ncbi:MAG: tetratricopeptide repeat protein, partial [Chloroflexi bacterium]|nr:tetratricopeptide repeat protein [Chloroflexota bacterium]
RRTYGVLGNEVNLAARLMGKAEAGQILASQHIAEVAAERCECQFVGPIAVKGRPAPVPVSLVLGWRQGGAPRSLTSFANPLVGREAELARMSQVLERALRGEGQILRLEGEPGVGKSHLAAEFARRAIARGAQAYIGACQSTTQDTAYAPWRPVFRALLALSDEAPAGEDPGAATARQVAQVEAAVDQINPDWRVRLPLLGDLLGLPISDNPTTAAFDPRLRQEALFALAVEIAQAHARRQPLLLLIEDAHWMDEASLGLTLALSRALARSPILLMLLQRPSPGEAKPLLLDLDRLPNQHRLELDELPPEGIAALVANRLQGQPSALALSLIEAQAQGNPFFAEELAIALREAGRLVQRPDGGWWLSAPLVNALRDANCLAQYSGDSTRGEYALAPNAQFSAVSLGIPDSVHGAVLSRLDRLPEAHKLSLKAASVIGRLFELDLLARIHPAYPGREAFEAQLETLEKRDFARLETAPPRAAYLFKHSITQEVVYETLLEAQQRSLHRAAGAALEKIRPGAVERLAYHFSRAGVRDKALTYLDRAARKAQRDYANETALNYYGQALALDERWEWRKGQVDVLHTLGRRGDEQAALRALEAMPDAPAYDVAYLWAQYYEAVSDYAQAQTAAERALAAARDQFDQVSEANSLTQLGQIARRQGRLRAAKGWHQQALSLFQGYADYAPEEAQAFAQALNGLGIVHRQQGSFEEARACYEQALQLCRTNGNRKEEAEALNSLGVVAYYQRHFAEALAHYQQALAIWQTIGDRAGEGKGLISLAQVSVDAGDYSQAEKHFRSALAIQQATGNRWEEVNVWNGLGILYQELGDWAQAEDCLRRGLDLSREIGDEAGQAYLLSSLGLVMRDQGDLAAAEKLLAEGLALAQAEADKYLVSSFFSYLGAVSLQAGKPAPAIEHAQAALGMRQELGMRLRTTADLTTLAAAHLALG